MNEREPDVERCAMYPNCAMCNPGSATTGVFKVSLQTTGSAATTWNGGVCGVCATKYLGSHTCSVESLLERSDELRRLAMEAFERLNPQPTRGPSGDAPEGRP